MNELYKVHRPKTFKAVKGQNEAVSMLDKLLHGKKIPHTILFSGPSGCGKTTLARILKKKLECSDSDFCEVNAADFRGIEMVRDIRKGAQLKAIDGSCRIWLIDEAHQMSSQAQNAFLKMLEDTPPHVYFFLATTDPQKLLKTIRTRCTEIAVKALNHEHITELLESVLKKEKKTLPEDVSDAIVKASEGSARKALVLLHQVIDLDDETEQLRVITESDHDKEAIELARLLMNPTSTWKEITSTIKKIQQEPEQIRWVVLGYASNVLLGGATGKPAAKAYLIIDSFRDNFFDSKRAGLVASCYQVRFGG